LIADAAAWRSAFDIRSDVDAQVAKWGATFDQDTSGPWKVGRIGREQKRTDWTR